MPFEWRQLEAARVPREVSRWLMDCQGTSDLTISGSAMQRLGRKVNDEPYDGGDMPLHSFEPFTNRWACWCWRVHLAVPDMDVLSTLDVARIYAGQEQLAELVSGGPGDLKWLDMYLRYYGQPPPLVGSELLKTSISKELLVLYCGNSGYIESENEMAGLHTAYFRVWMKFVLWLKEEEESNGSSEEARERQTEESW